LVEAIGPPRRAVATWYTSRPMAGSHGHSHPQSDRPYGIGIALNVGFVLIEASLGVLAGSLALVADAGHNLSDVLGLALAWGAARLARLPATQRRTYGMRRSTILAALLNALILIAAMAGISWEAVRRLSHPQGVAGWTVIGVALMGVVINGASALLFANGRKADLNVAGAFIHMAADAAVSAGVVLAGLGIVLTGWQWLDPLVSLAIVLVILVGTWGLLRDSVNLALDAVPPNINVSEVQAYLASLPSVLEVHDLHVWAMSTTEVALTAHLVKPDPANDDVMIAQVTQQLRDRFGIQHSTIQWERVRANHPCGDPCADHTLPDQR
jgi:cobalt-zinc-cadmium efflux system protein